MTNPAKAEIHESAPFWMLPPASLAEQAAQSDTVRPDAVQPAIGLTSAEAARRLAADGPNVIADKASRTILRRILGLSLIHI
jgi:hypothetical protein